MYEDGEDRSKTYGYKIRNFFVMKLLGEPVSVLDVGCSHGHFLASLTESVEPKVGVDIVRVPLNDAKRKSLSIVLADAHLLPFRDEAFQLVTAREVIEHLVAPYEALKEWARVSSKSIIISSPVQDGYRTYNPILYTLWRMRDLMVQRQRRTLTEQQRLSKESGHISVMTKTQILNLFSAEKNWKTEKYIFSLRTPLALVLDMKSFPKQLRKLVLRIEILLSIIPARISTLLFFEGFAAAVKFTRL